MGSKRGDREKRRKGPTEPRESIGTKKPRELMAKMAELYWNQKLREGKESPGPELERFRVGGTVTSAGRSHGYWGRLVLDLFGTSQLI